MKIFIFLLQLLLCMYTSLENIITIYYEYYKSTYTIFSSIYDPLNYSSSYKQIGDISWSYYIILHFFLNMQIMLVTVVS